MLSTTQPWSSDHFSLVERVWAATPSSESPSLTPSTPSPSHAPYRPPPGLKNELFKTEMCRSYVATGGFCRYGAKCQFAHGVHELRPVRRHPRYKTKMCRNWSTHGSCPYGIRCRFIHAENGGEVGVNETPAWATAAAAAAAAAATPSTVNVASSLTATPAVALPSTAPAAVTAAYDIQSHGPLSNFTRDILAELPGGVGGVTTRASPPRLAVFEDLAPGEDDLVVGIDIGEEVVATVAGGLLGGAVGSRGSVGSGGIGPLE